MSIGSTRAASLGLQAARQLLGKGIKLAMPLGGREFWLDGIWRQMPGHYSGICLEPMATNGFDPQLACRPRDLADRQLLPQMHPSLMFNSPQMDHSVAAAAHRFGGRFTWLSSK